MQDYEKFCEEIEKDLNQNRGIIFEAGNDGVLPIHLLRLLVKIENAITDT